MEAFVSWSFKNCIPRDKTKIANKMHYCPSCNFFWYYWDLYSHDLSVILMQRWSIRILISGFYLIGMTLGPTTNTFCKEFKRKQLIHFEWHHSNKKTCSSNSWLMINSAIQWWYVNLKSIRYSFRRTTKENDWDPNASWLLLLSRFILVFPLYHCFLV